MFDFLFTTDLIVKLLTEIFDLTSATVEARISGTQIDWILTIDARIAIRTYAHVLSSTRGHASTRIARVREARVHERLAVLARVLRRTHTRVVTYAWR